MATVQNLQKYKDAGLNVLFTGYVFGFSKANGNFESSRLKSVMDMAAQVGLKVIVLESSLYSLSGYKTSLIVADGSQNGVTKFASQQELNERVAYLINDIVEHEAFYGFTLYDEPKYTQFTAMGQIYKAIKTVVPDAYVNMNLLPYSPGLIDGNASTEYYCSNEDSLAYVASNKVDLPTAEKEACYKAYLQAYYDATGAEIIQYDDYPIKESGVNGEVGDPYVLSYHLAALKVVAEFCRDNDLQFNKVLQSCGGMRKDSTDGTFVYAWKKPTENDYYWQAYLSLAMGVEGYSYWSYYPVVNQGSNENYDATSSFVNREGNINETTYNTLQTIHAFMQKYAKVLKNFEYREMGVYYQFGLFYDGSQDYLKNVSSKLTDVNVKITSSVGLISSEGVALLATKLYDEENGQKGYWFVNAEDPATAGVVKFEVVFGSDYKHVVVYNEGEYTILELDGNGKASFYLDCGRGVFVLPY